MANLGRLYQRTDVGLKALQDSTSALRTEMRCLLGLISAKTHADVAGAGMRGYTKDRIAQLLSELESLGFVESVPATTQHDLDFTSTFSLAALATSHNSAR